MLASPIVLYDYPQIAPESAGDLFDGTEIDEILALRILTLTDEEKREARESDERARRDSRPDREPSAGALGAAARRRARAAKSDGGDAMNEWEWRLLEERPPVDRVAARRRRAEAGRRGCGCARGRAAATPWTCSSPGRPRSSKRSSRTTKATSTWRWCSTTTRGGIFGFLRQPGHRFFYTPDGGRAAVATPNARAERPSSPSAASIANAVDSDCRHRQHLPRRRRLRRRGGAAAPCDASCRPECAWWTTASAASISRTR